MRKALKAIFYAGVAALAVMFVLSLLGIIDNNRGNAFGFSYHTNYLCFLLTMAMVYLVLTDGWLTWVGELGLVCLDIYTLWLTGKTVFVCLSMLIIVVMWRHYRACKGIPFTDKKRYGLISVLFRIIYLPIAAADYAAERTGLTRLKPCLLRLLEFSFPICFAVNCLLVFSYRYLKPFWNSISVLSTFRDRLIFGLLGIQEYPVTLFGNYISYTGLTSSELEESLYFVLDSGYLKILLEYGAVPFVIVLGTATLVQVWNYRCRNYIGLITFSVFALDALIEFQITNWILLLVFVSIYNIYSIKPGIENCDRWNLGKLSSCGRWILAVSVIVSTMLLFCWCSTAYQITNWRGWTPEYGATVVVPGEYLSADVDLIDAAGEYLLSHPDAACIVSTEEERERLTDIGVAGSRIFIADSGSIDELLVSSREIIQSEELPNRLTVCAYSMQLERISRHAESLHIPVNAISVKPDSHYLSLFAGEQWRLLCGD